MNTAQALAEVARLVQADGFPVTFRDGWQHRGSGPLVPRGAVNHWTAGPREGDHPSLDIVTYGRPGLRNALCNTYSSREPRLYIIAAKTAWHAGRGSWHGVTGNPSMLGHEAENSGQGEWTDRHLDLIASLDRAQVAVFGFSVDMVCDHFEWTSRKIDRKDVGGPSWRERIRARPQPEEDELVEIDENTQKWLQQFADASREAGMKPNSFRFWHRALLALRRQTTAHHGDLDAGDADSLGVRIADGANSGHRVKQVASEKGFGLAEFVGKAADLVRSRE